MLVLTFRSLSQICRYAHNHLSSNESAGLIQSLTPPPYLSLCMSISAQVSFATCTCRCAACIFYFVPFERPLILQIVQPFLFWTASTCLQNTNLSLHLDQWAKEKVKHQAWLVGGKGDKMEKWSVALDSHTFILKRNTGISIKVSLFSIVACLCRGKIQDHSNLFSSLLGEEAIYLQKRTLKYKRVKAQ